MNGSQHNILFIPAIAGLFFFMKKSKVEEAGQIVSSVYSPQGNGLTGVARYLEGQKALVATAGNVFMEDDGKPNSSSGVEKYIQNMVQHPITGVARYAIKQALAEKQAKKNAVKVDETGVAKYLKNQKAAPVSTGVSKYLKKQENTPRLSKVSRYVAKQALVERMIKNSVIHIEETGVEKYLKYQESLPKASRVARYLAKQALLTQKEKQSVAKPIITGVSRYLAYQDNLPKTSRVAKYIAKQVTVAKQKKLEQIVVVSETSVDRYMRNRA